MTTPTLSEPLPSTELSILTLRASGFLRQCCSANNSEKSKKKKIINIPSHDTRLQKVQNIRANSWHPTTTDQPATFFPFASIEGILENSQTTRPTGSLPESFAQRQQKQSIYFRNNIILYHFLWTLKTSRRRAHKGSTLFISLSFWGLLSACCAFPSARATHFLPMLIRRLCC